MRRGQINAFNVCNFTRLPLRNSNQLRPRRTLYLLGLDSKMFIWVKKIGLKYDVNLFRLSRQILVAKQFIRHVTEHKYQLARLSNSNGRAKYFLLQHEIAGKRKEFYSYLIVIHRTEIIWDKMQMDSGMFGWNEKQGVHRSLHRKDDG